jgi:Raf kinase inhibitor-like YbhB/YbcL family protein
MIQLTSSAFENGQPIPRKYSGEGEDISPPLSWNGIPEGTEEIAIICDDPDAPTPEPWVHWVVYGISPDKTSLPEGSVEGAKEGTTNFDGKGYGGPYPPKGHGVHHYHFKLYALDQKLDLGPGATKTHLLKEIAGHVLDEGELIGTYKR